MTRRRPQLTGPQLEDLIAEETGLYDFLTNTTRETRYIEARSLAYIIAHHDNWTTAKISRWSGRSWRTINHSLNTHGPRLVHEAMNIYYTIYKW